jgi:murein DD-endopeptidase MepM/ murein hydrolase activator NlpD
MRLMIAGRRGLAAVLATVALAASALPAAAESTEERKRELRDLIGEASEAEAAALAELADIRDRRAAMDARLAELDAAVGDAAARLDAARRELEVLTAARLSIEARLDRERARLRTAQGRFEHTAAALYKSSGVPARAYASLVIGASRPSELASGTQYLEQVSRRQRGEVDELVALRERLERLSTDADKRRRRANEMRATAETERDRLSGLRAEQAEQRAAVAADEAREQQLVAEIRARKDEFAGELAALEATSNAITEMLHARQSGQRRATDFHVERPVPGEVTSSFGPRIHPILGTTRMHNGVDMHASFGSPIHAGASGLVVWSGWRQGYGNTVIVDHGNQYATLYAHASTLEVSYGERVDAGETVALVGATGLATAPHLHFEVRLLGVPQNPVRFF